MEYLDIIDEIGNLTGENRPRNEVHRLGLKHHASGLIIISAGGILSQQRSYQKEKNAGLWDLSAAGHISSGETPISSLIREIKEEIGISVDVKDLKLLGKYWRHEVYREDFIENELDYIYVLEKEIPINEITIQQEEVEDVKWIEWNEFKSMIKRGEVVKREAWKDLFDKYCPKNN